ncbi:MAG: DUF5985 family protein [Thermoanaerobaculia bacterium]
MKTAVSFLSGFLTMGYGVASLFFFRFWRNSRDRLFLFFGLAFLLLGIDRLVVSLPDVGADAYVFRAVAFLVILAAIVDKNRR